MFLEVIVVAVGNRRGNGCRGFFASDSAARDHFGTFDSPFDAEVRVRPAVGGTPTGAIETIALPITIPAQAGSFFGSVTTRNPQPRDFFLTSRPTGSSPYRQRHCRAAARAATRTDNPCTREDRRAELPGADLPFDSREAYWRRCCSFRGPETLQGGIDFGRCCTAACSNEPAVVASSIFPWPDSGHLCPTGRGTGEGRGSWCGLARALARTGLRFANAVVGNPRAKRAAIPACLNSPIFFATAIKVSCATSSASHR